MDCVVSRYSDTNKFFGESKLSLVVAPRKARQFGINWSGCGCACNSDPMVKKVNLSITTWNLRRAFLSFLLAAAAFAGVAGISSSRATDQAGSSNQNDSAKIARWVVDQTVNGRQAEFIVVLSDQADLTDAATMRAKADKARFVRDTLWNKAQTTQVPIVQ